MSKPWPGWIRSPHQAQILRGSHPCITIALITPIAWAKLASMAEGAWLATRELRQAPGPAGGARGYGTTSYTTCATFRSPSYTITPYLPAAHFRSGLYPTLTRHHRSVHDPSNVWVTTRLWKVTPSS